MHAIAVGISDVTQQHAEKQRHATGEQKRAKRMKGPAAIHVGVKRRGSHADPMAMNMPVSKR